jgi:hypothetical protein
MSTLVQKNEWYSKIQSIIRIENQRDDQKIVENTFLIERSNSKDLIFSFDSVTAEEDSGDLLPQLDRTIDLIRLGFSSSVYFNGGSNNGQEDFELSMINNQIEKLYGGFENDERNVENGISNGEILFSRSVKLSCYELFDNHIVDLCSLFIDGTSSTQKNEDNVRLLHGTVTNLIKTVCPSAVSAISIVNHAMQVRLHLSASTAIAPHEVKASDSGNQPLSRVIGTVGFVFIVAEVEQLIYTIASGKVTTRESRLEYVFIPPTEVFTFKPNKHEVMKVGRFTSYNKLITEEDVKVRNAKLLTSLQGGLQSLGALTRVVNALKESVCAGDSDNPFCATSSVPFVASNIKQHIPFRDSLFTQLLKPSLQGNCNVCIVSTINGTSESLTSMLCFATNIGSLYNTIWINDTSRQPHVFITEGFQLKLNAFATKTKSRAEIAAKDRADVAANDRSNNEESTHIDPMVKFNLVLSNFESNIDNLANFSESFWSMDAEKERQLSLTSMGITCIVMPAPKDENDNEKEKVNIDKKDSESSNLPNFVGPPNARNQQSHKDEEDLEWLPNETDTVLLIHEKVELLSSGRISPKLGKLLHQKKRVSSIRRNGSEDVVADVSANTHKSTSINHEEVTLSNLSSPSDEVSSLPVIFSSASNEEGYYAYGNDLSDGKKRVSSLPVNRMKSTQLPGFSPKRNSLTQLTNSKVERTEFPPIKVSRQLSGLKSNTTRRPSSALRTNRKGGCISDPLPFSANQLFKTEQSVGQNISISAPAAKSLDAVNRKDSVFISPDMNYKESSVAAAIVGFLTSIDDTNNSIDNEKNKRNYKEINNHIKNGITITAEDISKDTNEGINMVSSA